MDLGFNLAQSNRDLKDPTSRQNFGDTSGLLCKNDLIPCRIKIYGPLALSGNAPAEKGPETMCRTIEQCLHEVL